MGRDDEITRVVVEAVDENEERERGDIVTLSTGVRLKVKPVPKHFIFDVTSRLKRPKPPIMLIEGKGREQENPDDPDYQEELEQWVADVANAGNNVAILRGSEIDHIPDEVIGPDSEDWKSEMELLEIPMIENERARYLSWVKAIAAPLDEDIFLLLEEIGRLTGVAESDVAQAVERFRRLTTRETD
jgi:hypothetical protein